VIGPGEPIVLDPAVTAKLDYEVELAVVIGKPGRDIPPERALEHVFGYTVANDVTAPDRQAVPHPEGGWAYRLGPGDRNAWRTAWATDPELGGRPYERGDVERGGYLQPDDVVTVEIDGIGSLTNAVIAA
jgi:2-keto-4-pentenoate hydratase/2-oxohepta-3-ene-1,7-dioic acid hydratase in catechol pathway